ncbi:Bacteriorhodopsin [Limimonas halophila]|uniref:Bacteriorhodopsin n=1 Tax=Limimonas halophila TaxID=1082479 RepID=A0A1G7QQC4_9PROT|nr:bacteriorhodopsin-like [Limimonas halophila]SDG00746.1 Bacteriorhodopsin [Limimonas halophila]
MPVDMTVGQYNLVYNFFSFTIAVMAASTLYFWMGRPLVAQPYKIAVTITGLVTFIAFYHYFRIAESWDAAFTLANGAVEPTGKPFNDAYRYVDWLLTVPLLMIELILIMRLPQKETVSKATRLGVLAAIMIVLGYPGEVATDDGTRWLFWVLAMLPFIWIVYELVVGLSSAIDKQPENAKGLVSAARWLTVAAWLFYPIVFLFPMIGLTGATAETFVQVGYSVADIVAKAVFGVLIFQIAMRKTEAEYGGAKASG